MRNVKSIEILLISIIGFFCMSCDSWFDYYSKDWELEPQYLSDTNISFGEESKPQILYITNNGVHSQISFSISSSEKWIQPAVTSGTINKGEDKSIIININRTYLPEGSHSGILNVSTDDIKWEVPVSATGINEIEGYPSYINFGSNDDEFSFKIRSLSGSRNMLLSPSSEWLYVSQEELSLMEYCDSIQESAKEVTLFCKRSMLLDGVYTSVLEGKTELGAKIFSIPVSVTIPVQDALTEAIDNFVFSVSKHLYWENDDVILQLRIKNHKYLKCFELIGKESYAIDDRGRYYGIENNSLVISPDEEGVMNIKILSVDKAVICFSKIILSFRDLSRKVEFSNIELKDESE